MPTKLVSAFACLSLIGHLFAQPLQYVHVSMPIVDDALISGDEALILLPPRIVADGVTDISWSGSGKFLLAFGLRPASTSEVKSAIEGQPDSLRRNRKEVYACNQATSKTQALGSIPVGDWLESFWFPNSDVGVGFLEVMPEVPDMAPSQIVVWLNPASGRLRIADSPLGGFPELILAKPDGSQAAIISSNFSGERRVTVLSSDGRTLVNRPVVLPEGRNLFDGGWLNPSTLVLQFISRGTTERPSKASTHYVSLDLATGRIAHLGGKPTYPSSPDLISFGRLNTNDSDVWGYDAESREAEIQVKYQSMKLERVSVKAAYLASNSKEEPCMAFVAADVQQIKLSPSKEAVAYLTRGVCLIRSIARLPKDAYLQMRRAAEQAQAMSNAKQSALALLMYAADYDDLLPRRDGDWVESVVPYIKNADMLRSFVFTFNGTNLVDVDNPAETELGYVEGPGGRAVAYLDGHVKWIPYKAEVPDPERSASASSS